MSDSRRAPSTGRTWSSRSRPCRRTSRCGTRRPDPRGSELEARSHGRAGPAGRGPGIGLRLCAVAPASRSARVRAARPSRRSRAGPVEPGLLAHPHGQEARAQLRLERLPERVVLSEGQRGHQFAHAERGRGHAVGLPALPGRTPLDHAARPRECRAEAERPPARRTSTAPALLQAERAQGERAQGERAQGGRGPGKVVGTAQKMRSVALRDPLGIAATVIVRAGAAGVANRPVLATRGPGVTTKVTTRGLSTRSRRTLASGAERQNRSPLTCEPPCRDPA
jgi:hypothetical protein